ncbi:sensor histidine kinase [Streptosporangium lutulentum]
MSERREQLEELRRAMVSDVAHELRTPLSNIRGWLEAAEDGVVAPDRTLMSSLLEEALLLQHVIDDLQDLAMADAGELRLRRERVNAADLLAQVATAHGEARIPRASHCRRAPKATWNCSPIRYGCARRWATWCPTPYGTLPRRHGRPERPREGDQVVIDVADTGAGIAAEDLPMVFERFWRAEKSRNRQTGGSGLGLSIVRKLVEAHGGTVSATSVVGAGSVFTLRLPV